MRIRIRNDAFSLLEVVIAMGLFAISLMGLSLMSSGLMDSNRNVRYRNEALQMARNCLETLRQGEYAAVSDSFKTELDAEGHVNSGIFKREVVVKEKSGPARKEVMVTVMWGGGGEHRVVLKTIFSP